MTDEERPVDAVYDISTGKQTLVPFTDDEWDAHKARKAEVIAERTAAKNKADAQVAEDEDLRNAIAAHNDPVVKALAARIPGLL